MKTGNLTFLAAQVAQWQKLTKIIQPLFPQPEQWQVVCYQHGILTVTGDNQALISQLGYLQKQYISHLLQYEEFRDLTKIQARLRIRPQAAELTSSPKTPMPAEARDMLHHAADLVIDPKLSQALRNLASNKK